VEDVQRNACGFPTIDIPRGCYGCESRVVFFYVRTEDPGPEFHTGFHFYRDLERIDVDWKIFLGMTGVVNMVTAGVSSSRFLEK